MVDDVRDLPRWMKRAEPTNRDAVQAALLRVAEADRRAFVVLAWLLVRALPCSREGCTDSLT